MSIDELLATLNEALAPIARFIQNAQSAPLWVIGGALLALGSVWLQTHSDRRRAHREREAIQSVNELKNRLGELQEKLNDTETRIIAVVRSTNSGEETRVSLPASGAAEQLKSTLTDFATSKDAREANVVDLALARKSKEATELAEQIAIDAEKRGDHDAAARYWRQAATLATPFDQARAIGAYERALRLSEDKSSTIFPLIQLHLQAGSFAEADDLARYAFGESRTRAEKIRARLWEAVVSSLQGDLSRAEFIYGLALTELEGSDDFEAKAVALANRGSIRSADAPTANAPGLNDLRRAEAMFDVLGLKQLRLNALTNLIWHLDRLRGDPDERKRAYEDGEEIANQLKDKPGAAETVRFFRERTSRRR